MSEIAFLYPGQGSQQVGMGAELLAGGDSPLERYLTKAEEISGLPVRQACLEGPVETLTRTDVAQPALFSVSLALTDAARDLGLLPRMVAGHSLGEYTAAAAAGALTPFDGMRLVCERGRLMAEIQSARPGAMAAVVGLEAPDLEELCRRAQGSGVVSVANFNTPNQLVVSGEVAAVDQVLELAAAAGARRTVRLQVGAAFHTELMRPVQDRLAEVMASIDWADPQVPLVANASAEVLTGAAEVREALLAQIASPVRWVDCVQALRSAGCAPFVELGPGRVLAGLVRQIDRSVDVVSAGSPAALAELVASRAG